MSRVKRLRRILWNVIAALSALSCVVTAAVWLQSLHSVDALTWTKWLQTDNTAASLRQMSLGSAQGRMWLSYERSEFLTARLVQIVRKYSPPGFNAKVFGSDSPMVSMIDQRWWIAETTVRNGPAAHFKVTKVLVPTAALVVIFAALPGCWLFNWAKKVRASRRGLCRSCGYDFRATPDRCPECGATQIK